MHLSDFCLMESNYLLGGSWLLGAAVPLGHLLACLSDAFTVKGVLLFWPNPVWAISVSNPKRRLTTGSPGEYFVLVGATALLVAGIWVANGGGILPKVNQSLGLKAGAIATYNQHAASHHVYAHVTGVWARDRTRANGRYLILGTAGSEFILLDGQGQIHKTGEQLIATKLATSAGEPARTTIQTVTFNDEPATAKLAQLRSAAGNGLLFLSGELTIDFPEEVELPLQPDRFQTASLAGASLKLEFCSLDQALELLKDQYAIGSVTVRLVRPVPLF